MDEMGTVFDDSQVSVVGKIFLAGVASAVLGCPPHIKVRGTPDQITTVMNAVEAARAFHIELQRPDAMVQDIMDKLQLKNIAAKEFELKLGLPWPL